MWSARPSQPRKGPIRRLLPAGIILFALITFLTTYLIWARSLPSNSIPSDLMKSHAMVTDNAARRQTIKDAFQFAWDGYYMTAFPHDELRQKSNTAGWSRNDWGATAVDALGAAILMEDGEEGRC